MRAKTSELHGIRRATDTIDQVKSVPQIGKSFTAAFVPYTDRFGTLGLMGEYSQDGRDEPSLMETSFVEDGPQLSYSEPAVGSPAFMFIDVY